MARAGGVGAGDSSAEEFYEPGTGEIVADAPGREDDTDPDGLPKNGRILVSSAAAAALDGPIPEPLGNLGEVTARVPVALDRMPELVALIEAARKETQTSVLGAMVDAMLIYAIDPATSAQIMSTALGLIDERRKAAAARVMNGPGSPRL